MSQAKLSPILSGHCLQVGVDASRGTGYNGGVGHDHPEPESGVYE